MWTKGAPWLALALAGCGGETDPEAEPAPTETECTTVQWYADLDADGHGDTDASVEECEAPANHVASSGDCDDGDPDVNPGADEICDQVDNDCDGTVDQGASDATEYYADLDLDGMGDPDNPTEACDMPDGYIDNEDDCDDSVAGPGMGDETNQFDVLLFSNAEVAEFCADCYGFADDNVNVQAGVTSLADLSCLQTVGGNLSIVWSDLTSAQGLENLTSITDDLVILENSGLADVGALHGIQTVGGDFMVMDNPSLSAADAQALLDAIGAENVGGTVTIMGNAP